MNNKNQETHYERLYASKLKDIEKNLSNFIKQKEKESFEKKYYEDET